MKKVLATLASSLPQMVLALAVLAIAGVLGAVKTFTGAESYGLVLLVAGAGAVSAGIILGSVKPNLDVAPHLVIAVAVLALVTILGARHVFTDSQVLGAVEVIFGGGVVSLASASAPTTVLTGTGTSVATVPPPAGLQPNDAVRQAQAAIGVAAGALATVTPAPAPAPAADFPPGTIVTPAVPPAPSA